MASKRWALEEIKPRQKWRKMMHGSLLAANDLFMKTCCSCKHRWSMTHPPAEKRIVLLWYPICLPVDWTDFRSRPDENKSDHLTKFSWTHSAENKGGSERAKLLVDQLCLFGPPHMIRTKRNPWFHAHLCFFAYARSCRRWCVCPRMWVFVRLSVLRVCPRVFDCVCACKPVRAFVVESRRWY